MEKNFHEIFERAIAANDSIYGRTAIICGIQEVPTRPFKVHYPLFMYSMPVRIEVRSKTARCEDNFSVSFNFFYSSLLRAYTFAAECRVHSLGQPLICSAFVRWCPFEKFAGCEMHRYEGQTVVKAVSLPAVLSSPYQPWWLWLMTTSCLFPWMLQKKHWSV